MNEPRHSAAAVSLNDQIFICGGCDGENVLKSCEVYDTKLNKWQHIPPMKSSRMRHSAVVHAGKVYVFGGVSVNSRGIALKSVECYNPEENRWTKVPDMPNGRLDHQSHIYSLRYKFVSHVFDVTSWQFNEQFLIITLNLSLFLHSNIELISFKYIIKFRLK